MELINASGTEMIGLDPMNRAQQVWLLRSKMYAKAGVISSPSFLRMERTLTGQTSIIDFDLTDSNGAIARRATEKRLKVGDTFTVMGGVMYISTSPREVGESSTDAQLMLQRLNTYPNATAFGADAPNLHALYNAKHDLTIDSTVFIEGISTRDFYRVGTAQEGFSTGAGAPYADSSWEYQNWGQSEFEPTIEISGQADVRPSIKLGTGIDLGSTQDDIQYNVVLYYYGYLNTGAASVFNDWLKTLKNNVPAEDIPSLPVFKSIR